MGNKRETKNRLILLHQIIERSGVPIHFQKKIFTLAYRWVERTRLRKFFEEISQEEWEKIFVEIDKVFSIEEVEKVVERLATDPKIPESKKELRFSLIKISTILSFLYFYSNRKFNLPTVIILRAPQGLGKTFIALFFFQILKKFGFLEKSCVILPFRNLKKQWEDRVKEFPEIEKFFQFITLQKIKRTTPEFFSTFKALVFDESQSLTKHSAIENFLITRYLNGKNNIFLRNLLFFIIPYSEDEGRILEIEKILKKKNSVVNPFCIEIKENFFNYQFKLVEMENEFREKIYLIFQMRRKKIRKEILKLNQEYDLNIMGKKFDKLCEEDLKKINSCLFKQGLDDKEREKVISKLLRLIKVYKMIGHQTQFFLINYNSSILLNLLKSSNIKINNKTIFEISEYNKPLDKLVEIIKACDLNKKILIYSWIVQDLEEIRDYIEKEVGEEVEILKEGKSKKRISIISEKNASGVDFSDFSILILFRFPKKSLPKLQNIITRIRGGEIYFIYWKFENQIVEKIIEKLKLRLGDVKRLR
jgi:hypothetical protein